MSVVDATAVNLAAKGAPPAPPAGGTPPPPAAGAPAGATTPPAGGGDVVSSLLAKHNLQTPEQLAEYIDGLAGVAGRIGNLDPEELVKSHETLTAYHKEWAKQEREKLKANEKPEETIARLEKELDAEGKKKEKAAREAAKVEEAKKALATWDSTVGSTITADATIPSEYHDFLKLFMGVNNPINTADPSDRGAATKLTKEFGIVKLREFENLVIQRYLAGKSAIPQVPPASAGGGTPPVIGDKPPKSQSERRQLAHQLFSRILGGGGQR